MPAARVAHPEIHRPVGARSILACEPARLVPPVVCGFCRNGGPWPLDAPPRFAAPFPSTRLLSLTTRSRAYPGNFILWLDPSDRVRIHEKVLDYEVDGVPTKPIPTCEICMEKERGVPDKTPKPEGVSQEQVRSDQQTRERRERRLGRSTRSTARSTKGSR